MSEIDPRFVRSTIWAYRLGGPLLAALALHIYTLKDESADLLVMYFPFMLFASIAFGAMILCPIAYLRLRKNKTLSFPSLLVSAGSLVFFLLSVLSGPQRLYGVAIHAFYTFLVAGGLAATWVGWTAHLSRPT
jgi:hypothetical protein